MAPGTASVRFEELSGTFFCSAAAAWPAVAARAASAELLCWNDALRNARARLGQLLGVDPGDVCLFHNTTSALQRVLWRLNKELRPRSGHALLTTDLEFPGTLSAARDYWDGPIVIAEVARLAWEGRSSAVTEVLREAINRFEPRVFCVSHVARAFGYQFEATTLRMARELLSDAVLVIDGAQAVGNIVVNAETLREVDFYIGCTHKWLCGPPTLGFAVASPKWQIGDPAQSYSGSAESAGAGNLDTLRATCAALHEFEDHPDELSHSRMREIATRNCALSTLFCSLLSRASCALRPVGWPGADASWPLNGIVGLAGDVGSLMLTVDTSGDSSRIRTCAESGRVMASLICSEPPWTAWPTTRPGPNVLMCRAKQRSVRRIRPRATSGESPLPQEKILRFCFHHFHTSEDIRNLSDKLTAVRHESNSLQARAS